MVANGDDYAASSGQSHSSTGNRSPAKIYSTRRTGETNVRCEDDPRRHLRATPKAGNHHGFRKPRVHGADVPTGLPRRLHLRARLAGGLRVGHGRRLRPVHRQARAGQPAHRRRHRQRNGQPGGRLPGQHPADRHRRSANPRDVHNRPLPEQPQCHRISQAVGQVVVRADARRRRARCLHAGLRGRHAGAEGSGVPVDTARRLAEAGPRPAGPLPMTIAEVNQVLQGHDLVIVIGAQVFRYYPYVAGDYLPEGTELIQLTVDPHLASAAPVGDSLLGDVRIGLEQLVDLIDTPVGRPAPTPLDRSRAVRTSAPTEPLTADEVYATLATVKPDDSAVVMESTSTMAELVQWLPATRSGSYFATGSGGIGWGVPGAVGVALGDRERE